MTVGIYALYWAKQDLIYVGQSQNLKRRWSEHKRKMLNGEHTNYKVLDTYNLYGLPEFIVLQECSIEDLNDLEIWWTKEYDSLNTKHGLNIIEAGDVGFGTNANASKYSKLQVLLAFRLLSRNSNFDTKEKAKELDINFEVFSDIKCGVMHKWLKDKYPFLYHKMQSKSGIKITSEKRSYFAKYGKVAILISPDGTEYEVKIINEFANKNNLDKKHLQKVISGERKSHKGWRLK